jgi:hypothetical protein
MLHYFEYLPDEPHLLVHLINTHLSSELGRIRVLENHNTTLIIFSRFPLLTFIAEFLFAHIDDQRR